MLQLGKVKHLLIKKNQINWNQIGVFLFQLLLNKYNKCNDDHEYQYCHYN